MILNTLVIMLKVVSYSKILEDIRLGNQLITLFEFLKVVIESIETNKIDNIKLNQCINGVLSDAKYTDS